MLKINELLKLCNAYNINSLEYGSTIYKNDKDLGLCLEIKETTFGYLTRVFLFDTKEAVEEFLNKYSWYNTNKDKYNIELKLDNYEIETPNLLYYYKDKELTLKDMLDFDKYINEEETKEINNNELNIYIANIQGLTNYLMEFKKQKNKIQEDKNRLKQEENDLKFELIKQLTIYYGRTNEPTKKEVNLERINNNIDENILLNKVSNLIDKNINEVKNYLEELINLIKNEELEDKYLVNLYSNSIYEYNISILKKQIEFVKNKINSEKNFNLKGTKIHNIDEELKSFLNNNIAPVKLEDYLTQSKNNILNKFNGINDLKLAYQIISGKDLIVKEIKKEEDHLSRNNILKALNKSYEALSNEEKACLLLYNSFYKDVCNFIIDNNYPSQEEIMNKFDFDWYYKTIDNIIHDVNNNHYLINYFKSIDFRSLESYIASIVHMCKILESISIILPNNLDVFALNLTHKYKAYSFDKVKTNSILKLTKNTSILFIPNKLIINEDTNEISIINTNNIYFKGEFIESSETININNYKAIKEKIKAPKIFVTKKLELIENIAYDIEYIKEQAND